MKLHMIWMETTRGSKEEQKGNGAEEVVVNFSPAFYFLQINCSLSSFLITFTQQWEELEKVGPKL